MITYGLVVLSAFALNIADAAKILVAFPMPSKSHSILGEGIVSNLLKNGHEVTYITPILIKNPPPNLHQVDVSSNMDLIPKDLVNIKTFMDDKFSTKGATTTMLIMFHFITKAGVQHENVQALINDPKQTFDLVIVEYMFNTMLSGLAQVFNCPLIWFSSVEPNGITLRLIDEYTNPAYISDLSLGYTPPMTFWQRTEQLIYMIKFHVLCSIFQQFLDKPVYNQAFGPAATKRGIELISMSEAELSASLMLANSHVSMSQATPLPQSCKSIGGYHIENDTKPLPEDLQKLMDNAKDGVIYFSMGSNLKSKDWPDSIKRDLLKTFGEFKQTVLWKFEEVLPDLPENVHILQWAPQHSVLAHPNCKVFITHGGLLSTTETIHFGVPIIGIPVFADQFLNVRKAVVRGFAKEVSLNYDLPSNLKVAITEILSDSSYRNKVKELSAIYHDRPVSPAKELVHWVNHVIKTNGAPHLRSPALTVPWYQKVYMDLLIVVMVIIYTLYKMIKLIVSFKKTKKTKVH